MKYGLTPRLLGQLSLLLISALLVGCNRSPASSSGDGAGASQTSAVASGVTEQGSNGSPASSSPVPIISTPFASRSTGGDTLFTLLSDQQSGVEFANPLDIEHPRKRLYSSGFATGGVCIGDVNGDDLPDLFFASGPRKNRLYLQTGRLQFKDVTDESGLASSRDADETWSAGAAFADIDEDGDLDLYLCNYDDPCQLFLNDGTGKFVERGREANVDLVDACLMPSFSDIDGDGDLDLFVVTNRYYRKGGRPRSPPVRMVRGVPQVRSEYKKYYGLSPRGDGGYSIDTVGRQNFLLRNEGDGTFTDISKQAGIVEHGHGLSATWWDFNGDRRPDLYVCNDFNDPDQLYRNNGDGTFSNVLYEAVPHTSWFSMGSDAADLNGDGHFDLLVADMSARTHFDQKTTMGAMNAAQLARVSGPPPQIMKNALLLGSGAGRMFEAAELAGLADTDWTWAVKLADYNNDALVDVILTNGIARNFNDSDIRKTTEMLIGRTEWSLYEDSPPRREHNLAMMNKGELKFADTSEGWGFNHYGMSYGAATGDLDRDGDLDMVVVNLDEPAHIYRNDSQQGNRVEIVLEGVESNRSGIGAICTLETIDGRKQIRAMSPYTGFLSSNEMVLHFGLGDADAIKQLVIDWPTNKRQVVTNLPINHRHVIREATSNDQPDATPVPKQARPLFAEIDQLPPVSHREQTFDDFAMQPLLPNKLSQLGPGLAVADCNGDGLDDIYMGGAKGQVGLLLIADGRGGFKRQNVAAFDTDRECEDMGAVWLDADADGDLDLYVVSGGVECDPDSPLLSDRLYINEGDAQFAKAPAQTLPELTDSGSVVCAADFDRDGDIDLFVGSRVIPGAYPESPASRLLQNDEGEFTDVTEQLAPSLLTAGLVTSGVWSDVDGDGWVDLLLTTEWGPIKLLKNEQAKLTNATEAAGLAERKGWFNGIAARDFDGDGDIDYAVTNFGLNTKYHASKEKPVMIYYGDFEGKGEKQIVEAEFEDDTLFPIRGRSCSSRAMPSLADKFGTYREFASASLVEIYTPTCIDDAERFECNTLESGILWNDGAGNFEFAALPRMAQLSPAFGVLATEVNGDGYPDLYLAQNFFTAQPETGRMDGGMGLLLLGSAQGEFQSVMPDRSGLIVEGDATAAVVAHAAPQSKSTLFVGLNDDSPKAFRPTPRPADDNRLPRLLKVALQGEAGNPTAYGSRVTVTAADGSTQIAEVIAGGGYLSQSSALLEFALPADSQLDAISVRWPDGSESSHNPLSVKNRTDAATEVMVQRISKPAE